MSTPQSAATPALAVLGAQPAFAELLPVGQLYFPPWEDYEAALRGIFQRQYYTNQGPLANELESRLAAYLSVKHAVCVTNATVGLSMAAEGLNIRGRVVLPAFTFIATPQSLLWSNLQPAFCDVDPATHHLDCDHAAWLLKHGANALAPTNLWSGACDVELCQKLAHDFRVPLYFDSAHGFGCTIQGRALGGFGDAEVFSFHATKILSAGEGGCITTNDDALAERLRNIRSSYGVRASVPVARTANGRMSEAQAAIALWSLNALDAHIARNRTLHETYRQHLAGIPGVRFLPPQRVDQSSYQYAVCEINAEAFGLSRDLLHDALRAENVVVRRYFKPGAHRSPPFASQFPEYVDALPQTDRLCEMVLQLPLGARVTSADAARICARIRAIQQNAGAVRRALESAP